MVGKVFLVEGTANEESVKGSKKHRMVNLGNPKICAAFIQLRLALIYNRLSGRRFSVLSVILLLHVTLQRIANYTRDLVFVSKG